jgi:hypothetical protein
MASSSPSLALKYITRSVYIKKRSPIAIQAKLMLKREVPVPTCHCVCRAMTLKASFKDRECRRSLVISGKGVLVGCSAHTPTGHPWRHAEPTRLAHLHVGGSRQDVSGDCTAVPLTWSTDIESHSERMTEKTLFQELTEL